MIYLTTKGWTATTVTPKDTTRVYPIFEELTANNGAFPHNFGKQNNTPL